MQIVGLPEGDTAQLLGGVGSAARAKLWRERRVIYCTPQTLRNDLEKGRLDARRVVLLVIDEAHRATGQYAYCQVIKLLDAVHQRYRILALSATPGTDLERVQSVIDSLHITRVEARSERDPDIAQLRSLVSCPQAATFVESDDLVVAGIRTTARLTESR